MEIDQKKSFTDEIRAIMDSGIIGFNVTVPYKQTIIPFLDELDPNAKTIGAVNTVVNREGKWVGYNTDGIGYVRSLKNKYPKLFLDKDKQILIIGAGGAARGIYNALANSGFKTIDIANRTIESAKDIAKLQLDRTQTKILSLIEAEKQLQHYDVIIQTTSVGMKPAENKSILTLENLKQFTIVSDIVYQPIKTKFLTEAKDQGAQVHFGHTMLLYQAQYAFEIWTDKQPSLNKMDEQLRQILEGR